MPGDPSWEWATLADGIEVAHPNPETTVVILRHPALTDADAIREWGVRVLNSMMPAVQADTDAARERFFGSSVGERDGG